jgi:hypothetical protein
LRTAVVLLLLLAPGAARGAVVEMVCDKEARAAGWCYSDQEGETITVFGVAVTGPAEAQCPQAKAEQAGCQASRVVSALSRGWQSAVTCSQPLVDAGVCHRTMLGKAIGNPVSRRQYADRELRAALWQIVSGDWRRQEEAGIGDAPPLLMDGKAPP